MEKDNTKQLGVTQTWSHDNKRHVEILAFIAQDNESYNQFIEQDYDGNFPQSVSRLRQRRIKEKMVSKKAFLEKIKEDTRKALEELLQEPLEQNIIPLLENKGFEEIYDQFYRNPSHTSYSLLKERRIVKRKKCDLTDELHLL